ncbi:hypothetical protein [Streptomyces liangshanensis]|uniref:hypothetical protein n=1 Tax=Streptomyces liangshanensis TaxID=2717324 RepID=UPI0036D7E9E8
MKALRVVSVVAAAVASLAALTVPVSAADAEPVSAKHCLLVLDQLRPGEEASTPRSYTCFTGPQAERRAVAAAPAAAVQLMTWATDANYGGEYTHIYGGAACDSAGYSFNPNSWWSSRLSSYLVHSGCNKSFARGDRGNASFTGDVPWVGSTLNDDIDYIKIWRG